MDSKFLNYYNEELGHLRGSGGEFADEFPKIAGRLGLDSFNCADPYVERLLEGFAFLAARVRMKLDDGFPRLAESILDTVFPGALSPIPAMTITRFIPDFTSASLAQGVEIPRRTQLQSPIFEGMKSSCEFTTAHPVTLWPLELVEAKYLTRDIKTYVPEIDNASAGIYLKLRCTAKTLSMLAVDSLPIFLHATDGLSFTLLEQLSVDRMAISVRTKNSETVLEPDNISFPALDSENSLMIKHKRQFSGLRMLTEYFTFPERFLFFEINGLKSCIEKAEGQDLEIVILLKRRIDNLSNRVDVNNFVLYCSPVVNLFNKRVDRINYDLSKREHHLVKDRTRPQDYEIHSVEGGEVYDADNRELFKVHQFYYSSDRDPIEVGNYFSVARRPRIMSKNKLPRSSYIGSEVFLSFTGKEFVEKADEIYQIGLNVICTNRDLPLLVPFGKGQTDFSCEGDFSIDSTRVLMSPTFPVPAPSNTDLPWRAVNHLRLNYLSLCQTRDGSPTEALRSILELYCRKENDSASLQEIEGIIGITTRHVTRRMGKGGAAAFVRGIEATITFDEHSFAGAGCYLLCNVMHYYLSQYVSINSFVETVMRTKQRSEVFRWKPQTGNTPII
ncbi:MAG: type VI secretion system baseplate subunit TssF [Kiritimatiellaeota bacterium]|nr:type VI secretion system baseplate subunit TssF [Kiritimatiellota bacterium]